MEYRDLSQNLLRRRGPVAQLRQLRLAEGDDLLFVVIHTLTHEWSGGGAGCPDLIESRDVNHIHAVITGGLALLESGIAHQVLQLRQLLVKPLTLRGGLIYNGHQRSPADTMDIT